jgi:hypothetical protein
MRALQETLFFFSSRHLLSKFIYFEVGGAPPPEYLVEFFMDLFRLPI